MTRSRRTAALIGAVAAVLLPAGCGNEEDTAGNGTSAAGETKTIEIVETDFALEPANVTIDEPGTYTFRAVNRGEAPHALEVEGQGVEEETPELGPGESGDVTVELEAGEYELYCPIGNHRELGMEGAVTVAGGAGGAGTNQTETEDEGGDSSY